MSLAGKKIVIGVTGSIAAYKVAILVRLLKKEACEVKVIMTNASKDFITPITLSTLSENPVFSDFANQNTGEWNNHVELGLWADLMIIAPASANTIAKAANGICDNLLLATYLSARCQVIFAPAMDVDMYAHKSTQKNIDTLKSFGNLIIDPETGELASGLQGKGRMAEPEHIVEVLKSFFKKKSDFTNKKILITAGPTYEAIDPVRFIGNHSSGKMGFAIAKAFCESGASVNLICGPVNLSFEHPNLTITKVKTAIEMFNETKKVFKDSDIAVFSAAVSDYRVADIADSKIKKKGSSLTLTLIENPDIASELSNKKKKDQITLGFALETENLRSNAEKKIKNKNLDLIVLNHADQKNGGFGHDFNKISILDCNNNFTDVELKSKELLAYDILEAIYKFRK